MDVKMLGVMLLFGIMLYACLVALMYFNQTSIVFIPSHPITATPADGQLAYEDVWLQTKDGVRLHGWYVPAPQARGTVLFLHGNAGNISHRVSTLVILHRLQFNTFILDYRGYGQSEGRPSEAGTYIDAETAWSYLVETRGVAPEDIIIFGRSLGSGVAAALAQTHPPRALILESTFTSIPDIGANQYPFLPVRPLAKIHYNTLKRLPDIHSPVLVIHSPDDEIVPYRHGLRLYEAANAPKTFLTIAGNHNHGYLHSGSMYINGLDKFLAEHIPQQTNR